MFTSFKIAATPTIIFGINKIKSLPQMVLQFGKKALIVTGKSSFLQTFVAMELFRDFDVSNIAAQVVHIPGEPMPQQIDQAVSNYSNWKPDVVVAIGGGSVMDAGKAISAMLCETGSIVDFLEDVGTQIPSGKKIPLITVPTTAGTGSEATKNAVITQPGKNGFKKSLRHDNYVPNIALIDPQLSVGCPPQVTAASGMDAFTQLLESYVSSNSNPMTDTLALEGMRCLIQSIEKAVENGDDLAARSAMSYAAMLSGITLANAGLGVVHGFAQPLGSLFNVPHGVVCGTLMGSANRITVQRLRKTKRQNVLEKYAKVAQLISSEENGDVRIDQLLDEIDRLTLKFQLPLLSAFGIKENDLAYIASKTGLKYHPVELSKEDMMQILRQRL